MKMTFSRRSFLKGAGAAGTALGATRIIGAPYVVRAAEPIKLRAPDLASGFSTVIVESLRAHRTDLKHGLDIQYPVVYTSVRNLYNDFVAGNLELSAGTWDSFAHRYLQGVPARLVGIISTGRMAGMLTSANGPKSLDELKGKTLAAMQVSGTYRLTKLMIEAYSGMKLEEDIKVQNVPNPVATVTMVAANRAAAALTWEPSLSVGLERIPGSRIFLNVGDYYKTHTGRTFPYMCLAIRDEVIKKHPDVANRVAAAYGELFELMNKDLERTAKLTSARTKLKPEVYVNALQSRRMWFEMRSMADGGHREDVQALADFMTEKGVFKRKIDPGFYASFA